MQQQVALTELIYPIWVKNLAASIDRVAENQIELLKESIIDIILRVLIA